MHQQDMCYTNHFSAVGQTPYVYSTGLFFTENLPSHGLESLAFTKKLCGQMKILMQFYLIFRNYSSPSTNGLEF
jgi:hypothetical protein